MVQTGIISWFRADRSYGFIKPDDNSKDVFLHISELSKIGLIELASGQKIKFKVKKRQKRQVECYQYNINLILLMVKKPLS
jgi:CspA family cold shock protein